MQKRFRGIVIKDGKILLMKRNKDGREFLVFPGGGQEEGETEAECCKRELLEEFGVEVKVKNLIYKISHNRGEEGFFVCDWVSGDVHKTNAEEYVDNDVEKYGTYEPSMFDVANLANLNVLPENVKNQLVKDLKEYGTELNRPTIEIAVADF